MYFFLLSMFLTSMRTPIVGAAARLVYFTVSRKLTVSLIYTHVLFNTLCVATHNYLLNNLTPFY